MRLLPILLLLGCLVPSPAAAEGGPVVLHLKHDGWMINAGTRDWLEQALADADADPNVRAVLWELDTPGGQLEDTREMVKTILGSDTPLIVQVGPAGSRAASAGVFLTVAAHVASMGPATHIGAAHPVMMGPPTGGDPEASEEEQQKARDSAAAMLEKVTNDTVAWGRDLAELRGRNADWVEQAVRESVSIGSEEALELNVVDFLAKRPTEVLALAHGRTVTVASGPVTLDLQGVPLRTYDMSLGQSAQLALGSPTVLYLLLILGLGGLWIEVQNPGLWLPGGLGIAALILAGFGLGALTVNVFAAVLILLGFGLLVAEVYVPSLGLLTTAGVGCLATGGWFLVERTPEVPVGVSPAAIAAVCVVTVGIALMIGGLFASDRKRRVYTGNEGMIGEWGKVLIPVPMDGEGRVLVHGERWSAVCAGGAQEGERVRVVSVDGLVLRVERGEGSG